MPEIRTETAGELPADLYYLSCNINNNADNNYPAISKVIMVVTAEIIIGRKMELSIRYTKFFLRISKKCIPSWVMWSVKLSLVPRKFSTNPSRWRY